MSYMRDSDRRTRGVGAIAAADNVSGARRMRQAQIHHVTRLRDRQMSAIAQGALGLVPIGPGNPTHASEGRDTTYTPPPTVMPPKAQPGMYIPPPVVIIQPPVATIPPPTGVYTPPAQLPPVSAPPAGPGATYDPGSSGVTLTNPVVPSIPVFTPPDLPEIPAPVDNTTRNLAIAGGVALAAYLLFFRNKGPT